MTETFERRVEVHPIGLARLSLLSAWGGRQAYVTISGGTLTTHEHLHFYRYWYSATTGDYVELKFRGSILIVVFGLKASDRGIANVYVDGKLVKKVDLYNPSPFRNRFEFISDELDLGEHTVRIEVSGEKNPSSAGYRIDVQGILVDPKANPHLDIHRDWYAYEPLARLDELVREVSYGLETTTPLGAGASYVGSSHDRAWRTHAYFHAMAFADVDGTIYIDQSHDNANWDYSESAGLTGGAGAKLSSRVVSRYVRIRYVNGATAQTVFRFGRRFTFS